MDTFTAYTLAPLMPEKGSMPTIGSVAANFARTSSDEAHTDFLRFSNSSTLADSILASLGEQDYQAYMDETRAFNERVAERKEERRAEKARRAAEREGRGRGKGLVRRLLGRLGRGIVRRMSF
ncbi:hypothetical protein MMC12_005672 [Toensbergia leucococca]|nr:hypothetical protein [Toensbergia leucococca]